MDNWYWPRQQYLDDNTAEINMGGATVPTVARSGLVGIRIAIGIGICLALMFIA